MPDIKVLITSLEYFHWGVYGGFGMFTKRLAMELSKHNIEVEVLVPKLSPEQKFGATEIIDGIKVTTSPRIRGKLTSDLYHTDADIIHDQYNSIDTYLLFRKNKQSSKVVTIQDLRLPSEREAIYGMTLDDSIHFGRPHGWKKRYQNFILWLEKQNINKHPRSALKSIIKR